MGLCLQRSLHHSEPVTFPAGLLIGALSASSVIKYAVWGTTSSWCYSVQQKTFLSASRLTEITIASAASPKCTLFLCLSAIPQIESLWIRGFCSILFSKRFLFSHLQEMLVHPYMRKYVLNFWDTLVKIGPKCGWTTKSTVQGSPGHPCTFTFLLQKSAPRVGESLMLWCFVESNHHLRSLRQNISESKGILAIISDMTRWVWTGSNN